MLSTIRQGDSGDLVRVAQYLIQNAAIGEASGVYDATFVAAVCTWQRLNSLTPDGVIGPKSWTKLAELAPTVSTSKHKKSGAVCAVQILLGGLAVDGVFGTKTKKAVAAYQNARGLKTDGKCGPKTWAALIGSASNSASKPDGTSAGQTVSGGKVINNCVHYLQWDSKWKNKKYSTHTSSQTIGNSGCGPSSMAMIMATFIDPKITPVEMCALSVANGYRTYSSGTAWGFYEFVFKKYAGFSKFITTTNIATLKAALGECALAVCSMNSNDNHFWTKGGHFIVAIGFDNDGYIYANDPNKSSAPRKQKQDKFKSCLKKAFIFWPETKETPSDPFEPVDDAESTGAIIDISKHDGAIDFAILSKHVSLVIARCSLGSDRDIRFDEYAANMNLHGVPFGVYCYSYARDDAKAKDEARKMIQYAAQYNPLFYVIDAEEPCVTNGALQTFVRALRDFGAARVGCYVAHHRYNDYRFDSIRNLFDFVWIPRYGNNDGTIEGAVKPKYLCDLWQYTDKGTIPGVNEGVDMNVLTGDGHDLKWFLGGDEN